MKTCPSCSAQCEDTADACGVCGHQFASAPKKTMMGFPSLAAALEEAEETKPADTGSQTLFGFPAQKGAGAPDDEPEDATSIIPASAFSFDGSSIEADDEPDEPETEEKSLRGTVAGMAVEEEYGSDSTEIVSGTAVFPGMRVAKDDEEEDDLRSQGTLMGMTLSDLQANAPPAAEGPRSTQFAIPAVQANKMQEATAKPEPKEEPEAEKLTDSPTQAWSPGLLAKANDVDGRKKLLDKIRKSRPDGGPSSPPKMSTAPDLSALKSLRSKVESDEDDRDTNEQPSAPKLAGSGILKAAKPKLPEPDEDSLDAISDPEFGLMETDIASGELLQQAVNSFSAGSANPATEPSAPSIAEPAPAPAPTPAPTPAPQPQPAPAPAQEARPRTSSHAGRGIYETFNGGASAPQQNLAPQQAPAPQPAAAPAPQPVPAPQPSPAPMAQPQPQAPMQTATPGHQPYVPQAAPTGDDGDAMVRRLQSGFGLAAGAVTLILQVGVFATSGVPQGVVKLLIVGFSVVLGAAAAVLAFFPMDIKIRSFAFFGIAVLMLVAALAGIVMGLPKLFVGIFLAALLALVAGAFPSFAKLLT